MMHIFVMVFGYGFCLQIGTRDICMNERVILGWSIVRQHIVWRGEKHSRIDGGYNYRCIKNGETVESISFRSPIVNHI